MSGSLNQAQLIGHLGADPESRRTQSGSPVVSFSMATSERWNDKNSGEKREQTEWHRIVIFNEGLCKVAEQYLAKGSKVFIQGKLQTRKWQDKEGNDRWTTEVVLGPFNSQLTLLDRAERAPPAEPAAGKPVAAPAAGKRGDIDDEIPF